MNKKISLGAALALLLIVAAFVFSITYSYASASFEKRINDLRSREVMWEKYAEIDQQIRQNYYDNINETQLMNSVATGYIQGIGDLYGRYISAEEYKKEQQEAEAGIGAVVEIAPDDFYLVVVEVYPDSPAEVAGIQPGDLIIQVDDAELSRENSAQMLAALSGPQGSNISLVTRRGSVESSPLLMTRRVVSPPTVLNPHLLADSTVAYLYISDFQEPTYDQFNRELLKLMDAGATSLIIDLRDNKSDFVRSAARILDKLLPQGVLLSASYKNGTTRVLEESDANQIDLPVVVITNAGTTGIGEVFAQSIKDFQKGHTVGTTTAGKGVMQKTIRLSDGSAIELSVAYYLTNANQNFHGTGVKADFEVALENWKTIEDESRDSQLVKAKEVAMNLGAANATEQPPAAGGESAADAQSADSAPESLGDGGEPEETDSAGEPGEETGTSPEEES